MLSPLIPDALPAQGIRIPVDEIQCSFRLLGFLPGTSHNSISPRLILHSEQIEVKVLRTEHLPYTALKQVSYKPAWFVMREQIILKFRDGTDYYIKPSYDLTGRRLLQFFQNRQIALSESAQKALAAVPAAS